MSKQRLDKQRLEFRHKLFALREDRVMPPATLLFCTSNHHTLVSTSLPPFLPPHPPPHRHSKQRLEFRHKLFALREDRVMPPATFAHLVSSILYERRLDPTRFGPYFIEPVIAGLEDDGTPFICATDLIVSAAALFQFTTFPSAISPSSAFPAASVPHSPSLYLTTSMRSECGATDLTLNLITKTTLEQTPSLLPLPHPPSFLHRLPTAHQPLSALHPPFPTRLPNPLLAPPSLLPPSLDPPPPSHRRSTPQSGLFGVWSGRDGGRVRPTHNEECPEFGVAGTADESLFGACESYWQPGLQPEELFETISQALLAAVDRDALSGWGATVHPEELFETISQALLAAVDRDAFSRWGATVHVM
ncbi:unnamed protein product [Closterium sp. NIES-64]|nr:unnamed protein product [Closterium sp. NIES-64]